MLRRYAPYIALSLALLFCVLVVLVSPEYLVDCEGADCPSGGHYQQTPLEYFWDWTAKDAVSLYTLVLAFFTAALSISTVGLWIVTGRAADAAKESASAARQGLDLAQSHFVVSQRPWVQILDLKLHGTLTITPSGVAVPLNVALRNFGKSPAESVVVFAQYFQEIGRAMKVANATGEPRAVGHGPVIFPDETLPEHITGAFTHPPWNLAETTEVAEIFVAGQVRYQFSATGTSHATPFIYLIRRSDPRLPLFVGETVAIEAADILIQRLPIGSGSPT